ncbi:diacylglycerol O-acyltransferase 2-like [Pristis pectinata]|uniref:diacylglycerol O-acyltransferase 2-like n=1 Tax=Pristis pectinata TaxID=685728 RepID=UPI00223D47CE|nr:diacylglycerol O-acyltransferase 2-like [Pristis pectinata]
MQGKKEAVGDSVPGIGPQSEAVRRMRTTSLIEALCVFQWVLTFLGMGIFCTLLTVYLLFTSLWPVAALYLAWLTVDRNTPERGGRTSQWIRNWNIWKRMCDYFPVTLVTTAKLSPKKNYILGYHPHGIMSFGAFCNFCTEATQFSRVFPGITPHLATLKGLFRLPIYRDYLMSSGVCPVSRSSLRHRLEESGPGNAVVIVVGGAAESMTGRPGKCTVLLKNRKGFVRLALEHGADLVPVYCFGENDVYDQVLLDPASWGHRLQRQFQKLVGFAPCLFRGQGLLFSRSWGLLPFARPLTTVVGEPIAVKRTANPSQEEVDRYHVLYQEALLRLFDKHKVRCGLSEGTKLTIQ